jgi:hypothetical protein
MAGGVTITRTDLDAGGFRRAAARSDDAAAARRMLALALVLDGRLRTEAAELNELGLAGLSDSCVTLCTSTFVS